MTQPQAVLWDMDGTLIDSAEFHWVTWRDTLAELAVELTRETSRLVRLAQRSHPRATSATCPPTRCAMSAS